MNGASEVRMIGPGVAVRRAANPGPMTLDGTNSYLLGGPDGWAVVDPGPLTPAAAMAAHRAELAAYGPVHDVLLTHRHLDHSESAASFAAVVGCGVRAADPAWRVAPAGAGDVGRGGAAPTDRTATPDRTAATPDRTATLHRTAPPERTAPPVRTATTPDRTATTDWTERKDRSASAGYGLADGQILNYGGTRVEVVAAPGHTADSVALLVTGPDGTRRLLTGDTVLGRGTTVIAAPDGDLGSYLNTLRRLRRLVTERAVSELLPGHGDVVTNPAGVLTAYLEHRLARLEQVRAARDAGAATAAEVVARVYADVDRSLWPAATQSVEAQLTYLSRPAAPDDGE